MNIEAQRTVFDCERYATRRKLASIGFGVALALFPAASITAEAQTGRVYRLGFLGTSTAADYAPNLMAFRQGLRDLGYVEGKNVLIEYRWAEGHGERLPALASELVRLAPDVVVTHATGIAAAQRATSTIPIVMGVSSDPVRLGLVKSLARPGGNTTGVASDLIDLAAKRLELLREAVPRLRHVAVLANLANAGAREAVRETEIAARKLGVRVTSFALPRGPTEADTVLGAMLSARPDGLIVIPDPVITPAGNARIAEFAARNRLPAMGGLPLFVEDGGLIYYGGDFEEGWRVAARYVDRILKGADPAELPIQRQTRFVLAINLKTAAALGLAIPHSLLLRADRVIE